MNAENKIPTTNEFLAELRKNEEGTPGEKMFMLARLCDEEMLLKLMNKHAMMVNMKLIDADPVYSFAAAMIQLAYPELMEKNSDENDEKAT